MSHTYKPYAVRISVCGRDVSQNALSLWVLPVHIVGREGREEKGKEIYSQNMS
jgi:hypothetical protein